MNNTGNPVGSKAYPDFEDNVEILDVRLTSDEDTFQDRLGKSRLTWAGIEKAGTGNPAIAVDAAARAESAASSVEQNAEQIAQDAAQQAVQDVIAGVDGSVAVAESAADRAETAASVAMGRGWVYPTVSAGTLARQPGEYFWVVSSSENEVLRLWLRGDSNSTDTGKALRDASAVIQRLDIADGAVDRDKLSGAFSALRNLPTNDLNLLRDECTWFGSSLTLENKPDDLSGDVLIDIKPHREDRQFIVQRIYSYPNMDIWWERVLVTTIAPSSWRKRDHNKTLEASSVLGTMIVDNAVSSRILNYGHDYHGTLPDNDLDHPLLKSGAYLVLAEATNLPPDARSSRVYLLEHSGGLNWAVQRLISTSEPDERWTRVVRLSAGTFRPWSFDGPAAPPEPPLPAPDDRLAGKKIVFLGDSITGQGFQFADRIAAALPNTEIINFGVGGTRMGRHSVEEWDSLSGYSIATAIATGDWTRVHAGAAIAGVGRQYIIDRMNAASVMDWSTVDYIVVGYGTNDFSGTPIGDQGSTDTSTYIGGTNVLINQILTANPRTRLMFWSPIWKGRTQTTGPEGVYGGSDVSPNNAGVFLIEYVHALLEACRLQHVEAINLYDSSGIGPLTNETYLTDLVHPTAEGAQLLADKIMGALMSRF